MSYTAVEVELENGRVWPRGSASLPAKAAELLTIHEPSGDATTSAPTPAAAGLCRFLPTPDFALAPEHFRTSMEADFFAQ